MKQWIHRSWEQARDCLAAPDVFVTNDSDKEEQLAHLAHLNECARLLSAYGVHPDCLLIA